MTLSWLHLDREPNVMCDKNKNEHQQYLDQALLSQTGHSDIPWNELNELGYMNEYESNMWLNVGVGFRIIVFRRES